MGCTLVKTLEKTGHVSMAWLSQLPATPKHQKIYPSYSVASHVLPKSDTMRRVFLQTKEKSSPEPRPAPPNSHIEHQHT